MSQWLKKLVAKYEGSLDDGGGGLDGSVGINRGQSILWEGPKKDFHVRKKNRQQKRKRRSRPKHNSM